MVQTDTNQRFEKVETEVSNLRDDFSLFTRDLDVVKSDIKALGGILIRIEGGVTRAQEKAEERSERSKPNLTAIVSVLITIISILVGGAWLIGSSLSNLTVRTQESLRERDEIRIELGRLEEHQWQQKSAPPTQAP